MAACLVFSICLVVLIVTVFVLLRAWASSKRNRMKKKISCDMIVGLFHPYCNAGGGGERVLWCAIRSIQKRYPRAHCVIYSGDCDANAEQILAKAKQRFNITLVRQVEFQFLHKRSWVEAYRYPFITLLGQSLGSVLLGWEALCLCVPDIYIDTMGYAFTMPLFKYIGCCRVGCYVHYPTISTDMLTVVSQRRPGFNNASFISNSRFLSKMKLIYYHLFAFLYGMVGRSADVIMVNSSWTKNHIIQLWSKPRLTSVVFPPCDTTTFQQIELKDTPSIKNGQILTIVSIAQFRPEKDHPLQLRSFCRYLKSLPDDKGDGYRLILVGSCRNEEDIARVNNLKSLCEELNITDRVQFDINASFDRLKEHLSNATIGLHAMWNEHFGIGVVECMAAGAITLAHNSGGPRMDIVTPWQDMPTGYLAETEDQYAEAMREIFEMSIHDKLQLRKSARASVARRFSEDVFDNTFINTVKPLFSL